MANTKTIKYSLSNVCLTAFLFLNFSIIFSGFGSVKLNPEVLCAFTINSNFSAPSCYGYSNGTANISVSGGSGNYSYSWSDNQTGATASNLSAATYTITVTDNVAACTATSSVTLTQPPPVIKSTTAQNTSCFGYNDGKAWITPAVSVPQPSYIWSGTTDQNDTLSGLIAGNYTVTVTDNSGCVQSTVISITQPVKLSGSVTSTNSTCNGANNGTATILPSDGTPPYSYLWNTIPAQSTATATNLGPGTFTIKLSDSKGCEFYYSVNISEAAPLVINNPVITKETCQLGNGKISITLIGGTSPYTYSWSPPANLQATSTVTNLSAGTYTVTVTDSKGCTTTRSAVVSNQFTPPSAFATTTNNVICFGAANGKAAVLASAGTAPYTYVWSPAGGVGVTANNLPPNTYTVLVTDANGCTVTSSATITQPAAISLNTSSSNVSCGLTDGSASVAPAGGTPPYTITWSNTATGNTANNLGAGTYTVTVSDAGPCTLTQSVTLIVSNPLAISTTSSDITCNGNADGTASVSASGGSGTFNYTWTPGGYSSTSAANLSPAVYTITVSDALNTACTGTKTVSITQPGILAPNIAGTNVTCNGLNNGIAVSTPTGGTAPYTYIWSTTSPTNSTLNLAPGTYSLTVTDSKSCTASSTVTIIENPVLTVSVAGQTDVVCNGGATGSATVSASGGTGAYTYIWTPSGGAAATATGRTAGTYTATIRDANNCSATTSVTITQPAAISLSSVVTASSCGVSGGSATITPSGGIPAYTYSWSSGITSNSSAVINLASGTYTVTVKDANSCTLTKTITIAVANPLVLIPGKTNLTCNSSADGMAGVSVTGGTGSYNYSWNPGGATSSTVNGLAAGTYSITVTDAVNNSCTATTAVSITQPAVLNVALTPNNIVCFGQTNGQITAAPSGGTGSYTYNWAPVAGTANVLSNLGAGIYTITVTDASGCTTTKSATVTEPPPLTLTMTKKNVSCIGRYDGGVRGKVTGGTPGYTYTWLPSAGTTDTIGNLGPGNYKLTITDANGCTKIDSAMITEPPAFHITTGGINPTCYNSDGTVYVSVTGGSGTFGYSWTPGGSTGTTISTLGAGSYQVRVTDLTTGCDTLGTISIAYPVISLTMNPANVTCKGAGNGKAWVVASGAAAPYTYLWSAGASTNDTIVGLSPSSYTVTVNDNGGCLSTAGIVITEPNVLSIAKTSANITCFNSSNGTATITASGGTTPYTYSWSSGQTTSSVNNFASGKYFITLTDKNNCTAADSVQITQPAALTITTDSVNISCNGQNNGRVSVSVNGGTAPYNYTWNPGSVLNDTVYNISQGIYSVTVSDVNGCTATDNISVSEPPILAINMNNTGAGCGANTGTATVSASGGIIPYTYLWSNGTTSASTLNLSKGTYTVTVHDKMGCQITSAVTITEPTGIVISFTPVSVSCNGMNDGKVTAAATGGTGVYLYSWTPSGSTSATLSAIAPGTYTLTVTDAANSNCNAQHTVTITEPAPLNSTLSHTNISCFGNTDGTAIATVTGGTSVYTYSWSNGSGAVTSNLSNSISNLSPQTYTVTIVDANGCSTTTSTPVTQPSVITTNTSAQQASCGKPDGKVWVTALGGTGTFTYSWSPVFSAADTLNGLSSGKFFIVVTDANGCSKKDSASLQLSTSISTKLSQVPVTCYGGKNGQVIDTASGGSGAYLFSWSPGGSTNQNPGNLVAGMYTVTVSDATLISCFKVDSILVTQPAALKINPTITKTACTGNNNYVATANVSGGIPGYTYNWSFGGSNPVENNLSPGTYVLQVQDSNGCDTAVIFSISGSSTPFILPPSVINPKCNYPNGSIAVSIFGGVSPYTYSWSPSVSVSDSAKNLVSGIYSITVTDAYNCTNTRTVTVAASSLPPNLVMSATDAGCFGANNGTATATAKAGSPPYTYSWMPTGTPTAAINGLAQGTYTVTVTDAKSCTATGVSTVSQPSAITNTTTIVDASCGNSNGSANANPSGGTPSYTYSWSNGSTAQTLNNLPGGSYQVTVKDNNGCSVSTTAVVKTTNSLSVNITVPANVLCLSQPTGIAIANVSGGTPAFTYNWSNGTTNATAANLSAGSYTVTVTDQNGCSSIQTTAIIQPPGPVTISIASTNTLCGKSDGAITATPGGGTPAYSFSWSNGSTASTISGVLAGNYTVTVTDNNGCSITSTALVSNTSGPSVSINIISNVLCFSKSTGAAVAGPTGGTPNYTYSWSNGITSATANGLKAGTYIVTVTDQNGCSSTQATNISQPADSVTGTINVTNAMCGTSNGIVTVLAGGGVPVYSYNWSTGSTAATITGLSAGTYSVTVTDNNGCSINTSAIVITMPGILLNIKADNTTCAETTDGKIKIIPLSGTPGYTYNWSNGSTTDSIINLPDGTYAVTVTDAIGCQVSSVVVITFNNTTPVANFSYTPSAPVRPEKEVFFKDLSTPGSSLSWNFGESDPYNNTSTLPDPSHTYYYIDIYCVTLKATNAAGCFSKVEKCIEVYADTLFIPNVFTPNNDGINDLFFVRTLGMRTFDFEIFDRWGLLLFSGGSTAKIQWDGRTPSGTESPDGTYYYVYKGVTLKNKKYEGAGFLQLIRGKE